jgi:hypothetical protein
MIPQVIYAQAALTRARSNEPLGHPLGIGHSTERTHTVLLAVPQKVFERGQSRIADFGGGKIQERIFTESKSAAFSFVLSFGTQKKEHKTPSRKRITIPD